MSGTFWEKQGWLFCMDTPEQADPGHRYLGLDHKMGHPSQLMGQWGQACVIDDVVLVWHDNRVFANCMEPDTQ